MLLGKEYILQPILLLRIRCKPCIGFLAAIRLLVVIAKHCVIPCNARQAVLCCLARNMHLYASVGGYRYL